MFSSPALAPLRRRDFRLLIGGQAISWIGNNFYEIAVMWLVLSLTGSTAAMAGVAAVSTIPQLVFSPLAGVWADRVNRRLLALTMDFTRGVVIVGLPTLAVVHHLAVWQIYVTAFVLFTLFTFFIPAREAMLPNIVPDEELPAANAIFQATISVSLFIGFALGGIVVAAVGVVPALYLDALSFAGSVITLALIQTSGRVAETARENAGALKEAVAGLRFVKRQPSLFAIFLFSGVLGVLVGPLLILPAPFSRTVLHAGARGYGLLEASFMLGNLVGAIGAGAMTRVKHVGRLLIVACAVAGVLLAAMSYMNLLPTAALFYAAIGVVAGGINVPLMTLTQRLTPDEMRGRVLSLMIMVSSAAMPLSVAVGGVLAQQVGAAAMYRIVGVLFAAAGVWFVFTPLARVTSDAAEEAPAEDVHLAVSSDPSPA
jgi:MFS family permease